MQTPFAICLSLSCLALLAPQQPAHAESYALVAPSTTVMRLRFDYVGLASAGGGQLTPQKGYFKFQNGSPDCSNGGWFRVSRESDGVLASDPVGADDVTFPIGFTTSQNFVNCVPKSLRDQIHVDVVVTQQPHVLGPNTNLAQTQRYPLTLGGLEGSSGTSTGNGLSLLFEPSVAQLWVDQDVTLGLEVWLDSNAHPQWINGRFQTSLTLRPIRNAVFQLSPYLVPVALIGQPPGDRSSSKLTVASQAGAGLAVAGTQGSSTVTQDSIGLGPFSDSTPVVNNWRSMTQGIQQTFSVVGSLNYATHNPLAGPAPYGPGYGDLMVCLRRPTFEMYQALQDRDFRLLLPGQQAQGTPPPLLDAVYFPMYEVANPQPGTPLAFLTRDELRKFRELDPLVGAPWAALRPPRFYLVATITGAGGSVGSQYGRNTVTRAELNQMMGRSTTVDNSTGFTLPLGAIATALGSPVPVPDVGFRHMETTTSSIEYRTTEAVEDVSTELVEYHIEDSNPRKWLYVEVYYDTLFHSFLFRDATPILPVIEALRRMTQLDERPTARWLGIRQDEGRYLVTGSLKSLAAGGGAAVVTPVGGEKPVCCAVFGPETGNMVIPNLAPGRYRVVLQKPGGSLPITEPRPSKSSIPAYTLTVEKDGSVTFE
jgi:hypothetical protein